MSPKKAKILSLFLIAFLSIPFILYFSLQVKLNHLEKDLTRHLVEDKKISREKIASVDASISIMPTFPVNVVFKDEPQIKYQYTKVEDDGWTQLSILDANSQQQ